MARSVKHPQTWTKQEVREWISWCNDEYALDLSQSQLDTFQMNGKALLMLKRDDFCQRAPATGDVIFNALQKLVSECPVSSVHHVVAKRPRHNCGQSGTDVMACASVTSLPGRDVLINEFGDRGAVSPVGMETISSDVTEPLANESLRLPLKKRRLKNGDRLKTGYDNGEETSSVLSSITPDHISPSDYADSCATDLSSDSDLSMPHSSVVSEVKDVSVSHSSVVSEVKDVSVSHSSAVSEVKDVSSALSDPVSVAKDASEPRCTADSEAKRVRSPRDTPVSDLEGECTPHSSHVSRDKDVCASDSSDSPNDFDDKEQGVTNDSNCPSSDKGVTNAQNKLLWEFIAELLEDPDRERPVRWLEQSTLTFRITEPAMLAEMWGEQKGKQNMTYEKLSRALRYYYKMKIINKVPGRKLTYKYLTPPLNIVKGVRGAKPGVPHKRRKYVETERFVGEPETEVLDLSMNKSRRSAARSRRKKPAPKSETTQPLVIDPEADVTSEATAWTDPAGGLGCDPECLDLTAGNRTRSGLANDGPEDGAASRDDV